MKRIPMMIVLLFTVGTGVAGAGELNNPGKMLKKGQFAVGFQGIYLFEQKFEDYSLKRSTAVASDTERKSAEFKEDKFYLATVSYGFTDWLDVFAKLGVVDGGEWKDSDLATGNQWEAKLKGRFVWGLGGKARVFQASNGLGLAVAAQYLRYDNRSVEDWKNLTRAFQADSSWIADDKLDYWQVDLMITAYWPIGVFTPYAGAGWSYAQAEFSGTWRDKSTPDISINYDATLNNEDVLAAIAGLNLDLGEHFSVNLQGTFIARTTLTVGLSYNF